MELTGNFPQPAATSPQPVLARFWEKRKLDATELTVRVAVENFISSKHNISAATDDTYDFSFSRFTSFMEGYGLNHLSDIDGDLIAGYIESLYSPYKKEQRERGEVNKRAWMLEKFWEKTWTKNYISGLCRPIATMILYYQRLEKLPRFYFEVPDDDDDFALFTPTDIEYNQILRACQCQRDFVMIAMDGDTGLRRHEIIQAQWGDIHPDNGIFFVRNGKGGQTRGVPIAPQILEELRLYRASLPSEYTQENSPIFPNSKGKEMSFSGFHNIIERIKNASKVPFTAHSLRRYAMRTWLKAGKKLAGIQEAAGHDSNRTTKHYLDRFEPVVSKNSLKTTGFNYLVTNKKITNFSWEIVKAKIAAGQD